MNTLIFRIRFYTIILLVLGSFCYGNGQSGSWQYVSHHHYFPGANDIAIGYVNDNPYIFVADTMPGFNSLYRSSDLGVTWDDIFPNGQPYSCKTLPSNAKFAFLNLPIPNGNFEGFYFTKNADYPIVPWTPRSGGLRTTYLRRFDIYNRSISDDNDDYFFAFIGRNTEQDDSLDQRPLFRTRDGGRVWHPIYLPGTGMDQPHITDIDFYQGSDSSPDTIAIVANFDADTSGGIYKTTNAGSTWTHMPIWVDGRFFFPIDVAISQKNYASTNTFWVSAYWQNGDYHSWAICKTTDNGGTWAVQYEIPSWVFWSTDIEYATVNPNTPAANDTLYASIMCIAHEGSDAVLKTTNGGASWYASHEGMCSQDIASIEADPRNSKMVFAGARGNLYLSENGAENWSEPTLETPYNEDFVSLAVASPNMFVFGGTNLNYRQIIPSTDDGTTWHNQLQIWEGRKIRYNRYNNDEAWALGFITISYNASGGNQCDSWDNLFPLQAHIGVWVNDILFGNVYNYAICEPYSVHDYSFIRSADYFTHYDIASFGNRTDVRAGDVNRLNPTTDFILFACSTSESSDYSILRSTNSGNNFERIDSDVSNLVCRSAFIDPNDGDIAYIGTTTGIYKTGNLAANDPAEVTWTISDNGIEHQDTKTLELDPTRSTVLYASCTEQNQGYVYITADSGRSWIELDGGLNNHIVNDFDINPSVPDTVYAATNQGLYKLVNIVKSGTITSNTSWGPGCTSSNEFGQFVF